MQDLAFAGQQVVLDAQAFHRAQVAANNGRSDCVGHFRRRAVAFLDGFQGFAAQRQARLVFFEELRDARVEVPAEIIELRLRGKRAHFIGRFLRDMDKSDDDIRDLDAGVVDIVLHFDAAPGAAKHPHQRIAQRGVAQVADMRGLVRIDIGVFHDAFGSVRTRACRSCRSPRLRRPREKRRAKSKGSRSPPPATSTRSMPSIGGSSAAISCAIWRGARFRRLASSKQTGVASSPISMRGGRSVTTVTSWL